MPSHFRSAGLSGLFAENAEKLGLDLKAVDYAVLSHAHDDHANGLDTFFELNDHAPLYVAEGCDENCYDRHGIFMKYAGNPFSVLWLLTSSLIFCIVLPGASLVPIMP